MAESTRAETELSQPVGYFDTVGSDVGLEFNVA